MIPPNMTQQEINERYEKSLLLLLGKLSDGFDKHNAKFNTKHGFLLMIIRDPSSGNVDVATNFPDEYMVDILKSALETAIENRTKQTLNP